MTSILFFEVKARLKIIKDARFFLLLFQDISFSNTMFSNSGSEEGLDSLLFDMDSKTVYNFKEQKAHKYSERLYQLPKMTGDSLRFQKGDTLIVISKALGKGFTPTPTIAALPYGISAYSTKRFSFKHISSKETSFSLGSLYERCVHFKLSNEKFQFIY